MRGPDPLHDRGVDDHVRWPGLEDPSIHCEALTDRLAVCYYYFMPAVVGIHGIAQQFKGGPQLTSVWLDAMRGGLEAAQHREVADRLDRPDVRVAFFGDLFRPEGAMAAGDAPYSARDVAAGAERDLLTVWYNAAVENEPSLGPPAGAMGPGKVAVQVMLERLARSRPLAGIVQRAFIRDLKQVNQFLDSPGIKERVLDRVAGEVDGSTRVLVGHSLGSIVAYEYLCARRPPSVELLVTLGSPLGIPNLVYDRLTPRPIDGAGAWPGGVARWVNVADADDIVALRKDLTDLFLASRSAAPIVDRLVDNGSEPHAIDRYLNSAEVGQALGSAL